MNKLIKGINRAISALPFILLICMVFAVIATLAAVESRPEIFGYQF